MDKPKMTNRISRVRALEMQWLCYALPAGVELFHGITGKAFG
jgi:hypothetical protein